MNVKTYRKLTNVGAKESSRANLVKWRNLFIRLRDLTLLPSGSIYGTCISCGKTWNVQLYSDRSIINLHPKWVAGHYYKEDRFESMAHDERNLNLQCYWCNKPMSGNESGYIIGLVKKIGQSSFDDLTAQHNRIRKYSTLEYEELKQYFKKKAKIEAAKLGVKI